MRRRLLIVLAVCLPLLVVGSVGVYLIRSSPSDESAAPTTSSSEASSDVPIEATTGSPTAAAPPTPAPPYEPPPTRGTLAASPDVLAAAVQRARTHFEEYQASGIYPPQGDSAAVLFAGDVGAHRVIVVVAPAACLDPNACPNRPLLHRVVLVGSAGAPVDQLDVLGNVDDLEGADEQAVAVGDVTGTVTVVAYPRTGEPVLIGAVPVGGDSIVWQPAADQGGWASAELSGVNPVYLVKQTGGTCGTTLVGYVGEDFPIDPVAVDAAIQEGCTAGMG